MKTVVHILAAGEHSWQPVALDYLLEAGANTELKTSIDQKALQIAVRDRFEHHDSPTF